jgi:DnaA family protein
MFVARTRWLNRAGSPESMRQLPLGVRWRDGSRFATFVTGLNAQVVRALLDDALTPAWIWGPTATGKTHLLQATCARAGELGRTAAYFPLSEDFPPGALMGCEQLDLVCIDDVQRIAGDAEWERALFVLYNAMQENGRRLVFAATRAPAACDWALPDLASRMSAALVFQLRPLSESEQIEVLRLRARARGLELQDDAATYLLRRLPRDLRSLCELLEQLDIASLAANRRLTVPFIRQVLERSPGS